MAKRVIEELVDDLDGGPAAVTVQVGWRGEWRELDLSQKNLATLARVVDRYWQAGRRVAGQRGIGPRRDRSKSPSVLPVAVLAYDRQEFKTWAAANGIELKRGRPPRDLVQRFLAAKQSSAYETYRMRKRRTPKPRS